MIAIPCELLYWGMIVENTWHCTSNCTSYSSCSSDVYIASSCKDTMLNLDGNDILFHQVIAGLWVLSIVGSWCNFLTLFYIGNELAITGYIFL
jgi:hypothetical protein